MRISKTKYRHNLDNMDIYDLSGKIEDTIKKFQEICDKYKDEYDEILMEGEYEYEYYSSDRNAIIRIIGITIESDEAFAVREKKWKEADEIRKKATKKGAETRKRNQEKKEKEMYEKLKKKYE